MRIISALGLGLWLLQVASASAADIAQCTEEQRHAYTPSQEDVSAHRAFDLPTLSYPFGTKLDQDFWGFVLSVRVDEAGRVACHYPSRVWGTEQQLNEKRRAIIERLGDWRYRPFVLDGQPVAAILKETLPEQEEPEKHVPLPDVPLRQVLITLERQACHGTCPIYRVEISGAGLAAFYGASYVDVEGEQAYPVPKEEVARLVERLRAIDFWSLRQEYNFPMSGPATHKLTVRMGSQTHVVEDHAGELAGMPLAVRAFEDEVDKVAHTDMWIRLSPAAIEHLKAEGYDFHAPAAGDLLVRAAGNWESRDNEAMLSLIELGVPVDRLSPQESRVTKRRSVIEEALLHERAILIEPLIVRGALRTNGKPDQTKIAAAFRAAIKSRQAGAIRQIWDAAGEMRPVLTCEDASQGMPARQRSAAALFLQYDKYRKGSWDGLPIAQRLAEQGCDIKAAGMEKTTLLHTAAEVGDAEFVRYLLVQGLDVGARGPHGHIALSWARNEETALVLLEAGADPAQMTNFRGRAASQDWPRVMAWLDARSSENRGSSVE
jgi:hypothetical protein